LYTHEHELEPDVFTDQINIELSMITSKPATRPRASY
jgi:hypothetical protein